MKKGEIKRKIQDRGFGFITVNDKEYFFHISQCITNFDTLSEGDTVQFNIEDSSKGQRAIDVEKI